MKGWCLLPWLAPWRERCIGIIALSSALHYAQVNVNSKLASETFAKARREPYYAALTSSIPNSSRRTKKLYVESFWELTSLNNFLRYTATVR